MHSNGKPQSNGAIFVEIVRNPGTIDNLTRPKHNYIEQKEDFIKQIEYEQQSMQNAKL